MRTVGVEEELLVVDSGGHPVPLGPDALEAAARRGEGETAAEHDRADDTGSETGGESAAHLMPELKAQQLELGTPVCTNLAEVDTELRFWRSRAAAAAARLRQKRSSVSTWARFAQTGVPSSSC